MRHAGHRRRRRRTARTSDQPQAASVPTEISVSIVAAPWRRFDPGGAVERPARPRARPARRACSASHCQLSNCSAGTIDISEHRQRERAPRRPGGGAARRARVGLGALARPARRRGRGQARRCSRPPRPPRPARSGATAAGSNVDRGLLGGVVDRRRDAVELVELASRPAPRTRRRSSRSIGSSSRSGPACVAGAHRVTSHACAATVVHAPVVLELQEQAVAARRRQLGARSGSCPGVSDSSGWTCR